MAHVEGRLSTRAREVAAPGLPDLDSRLSRVKRMLINRLDNSAAVVA
jgi:hypothetical protein